MLASGQLAGGIWSRGGGKGPRSEFRVGRHSGRPHLGEAEGPCTNRPFVVDAGGPSRPRKRQVRGATYFRAPCQNGSRKLGMLAAAGTPRGGPKRGAA